MVHGIPMRLLRSKKSRSIVKTDTVPVEFDPEGSLPNPITFLLVVPVSLFIRAI